MNNVRGLYYVDQYQSARNIHSWAIPLVSGKECDGKRCPGRTRRQLRLLGSTWRAPYQNL